MKQSLTTLTPLLGGLRTLLLRTPRVTATARRFSAPTTTTTTTTRRPPPSTPLHSRHFTSTPTTPSNSNSNSSSPTPTPKQQQPITSYTYTDLTPHPPPNTLLIDVREPSEYAAGHIPAAVNLPILSHPDAMFLPPDEFRERFGFEKPVAGGGGEVGGVVFYCKAGIRSAAAARVAVEAGWAGVGEYKGSWVDWSRRKAEEEEGGEGGVGGKKKEDIYFFLTFEGSDPEPTGVLVIMTDHDLDSKVPAYLL
ncbi:Rhodanese-like domain-containing protein [Peziza echinospora]|nr:Rhodanese-like domain-containing protein [Peziza echinospora]